MATAVMMPKVGISVESCIITKWHKKKGDTVKEGDVLFSYETDKAAVDEEAKVSGTMLELFAGEGDDVPVMQNVCVIGAPGEDTSAFKPHAEASGAEEAPANAPAQAAPAADAVPAAVAPAADLAAGEIKVSPRARHLAEHAG
ncbi:MAG: 2-oxo acid dehydrogenase subunit E2, partial [Clostridia bacterium]|nr:2-oxo acid dehydrogenase subunit E2 [Clostridia bacterium]